MRALLVQSPATSPWVPRRQWEPPSIALATIAGQIDNHDVRVADMIVWRKHAVARFIKVLDEFKPDVVGFTSMTFQYDSTLRLAALTKPFTAYPHRSRGVPRHVVLRPDRGGSGPRVLGFSGSRRGRLHVWGTTRLYRGRGKNVDRVLGLSYRDGIGFSITPAAPSPT